MVVRKKCLITLISAATFTCLRAAIGREIHEWREGKMALAEYWANHYMAGVLLLHTLLGGETAVVPNSTPSPDGLVLLLNEVARGEYHPEKYFTAGTGRGGSVLPAPPKLAEDQVYSVIRLNAETRRNKMVSVEAGGLIFEEPIWAILAAESLSPRHSAAKFALQI